MLPRVLVPALDPDQPDAVLPAGEAHHLTRVLRLNVGDDVRVFDGRGSEFTARILSIGWHGVAISLLARADPARMPALALTLVASVLKGEAMDTVVRDATMVGVRAIQPIVSARTTVKTSILPKAVERWRRIALASAKQCGRSVLPEIAAPIAFDDWAREAPSVPAFLLVEPAAAPVDSLRLRDLLRRPPPPQALLVTGPEGGWTSEEVRRATGAGCTPVSLGPLTLRADAIPLAAAAAMLSIWEE